MTKKRLTGNVVSNKMQKTVVVSIDTSTRHPIYGKMIKRNKRIKARADMELLVGDQVTIEETRPLSKSVSWLVVEKLKGTN